MKSLAIALFSLVIFDFADEEGEEQAVGKAEIDLKSIVEGTRYQVAEYSYHQDCVLINGIERTPFRISRIKGESTAKIGIEGPDQLVVLKIKDQGNGLQLSERLDGGQMAEVKEQQAHQAFRGTDLTYDDLARRFLYWPGAKVVGNEKLIMGMRDCWILRFDNPRKNFGPHAVVKAWIDKETKVLLRTENYNWDGRKVRQTAVTRLQPEPALGKWLTKEMKFEVIDVRAKRKTSTTVKFGHPVVQ